MGFFVARNFLDKKMQDKFLRSFIRTLNFMKMKKLLIIVLVCFPILALGQRKPKIKGNRVVTEVSETLPPFEAISLEDDLQVQIKKSFGEGYNIVADDNLVDVLKLEVVDGTLVISSFYDILSKKKLEITVNFVELKAITVKAGKIYGDDTISTDALYLNVFGNSDLEIDAYAFVVNLNSEDNSKSELKLDVDSLNVLQRQRSKAFIYMVGGVNQIELQDNGDLTLEGTAEEMTIKMMANSRLKTQKCETGSIDLSLDENAVARIQATKALQLSALGDTKTYLYGNPKISILDFMDTTQLIKKQLE